MDTVLVFIRHRKFSGEARLRHLPFLHGSTGIRDKINATVLRTVATRESEKNRLEIPDHALDFHTKRGRKMGHVIDAAGWDHWARGRLQTDQRSERAQHPPVPRPGRSGKSTDDYAASLCSYIISRNHRNIGEFPEVEAVSSNGIVRL